jgi:hypothetical protein
VHGWDWRDRLRYADGKAYWTVQKDKPVFPAYTPSVKCAIDVVTTSGIFTPSPTFRAGRRLVTRRLALLVVGLPGTSDKAVAPFRRRCYDGLPEGAP